MYASVTGTHTYLCTFQMTYVCIYIHIICGLEHICTYMNEFRIHIYRNICTYTYVFQGSTMTFRRRVEHGPTRSFRRLDLDKGS